MVGKGDVLNTSIRYVDKPWLAHYQHGVPDSIDYETLCLPEILDRTVDQFPDRMALLFEGYQIIWNPAIKPGYSGVATFLKNGILEYSLGVANKQFDNEGRVIWTNHSSFGLYNIYFPNGGRDHSRVPYKLAFTKRENGSRTRPHPQPKSSIFVSSDSG